MEPEAEPVRGVCAARRYLRLAEQKHFRPEKLFDLLIRKLSWVRGRRGANTAEQSSPPLYQAFSAFGPLGRGLLRFLSSSCSHSRWAGFSLAAPFCRHRRSLAPRPTAGGKTRPKCQSQSVVFRRCKEFVNGYFTRKGITI